MKTRKHDRLRQLLASAVLLAWAPAFAQERASDEPPRAGAAQTGESALASESPGYLRSARNAFIDALDFQAALGPARALVTRAGAADDPELPRDVAALARVEAELEDFVAAERDYLKAIELIEKAEGEFSVSLVEAYQGLGRSYIKNRQFTEAVTALDQARHISQRNLGLFNVTQTPLIDDLTTAYLGLGDTITAQRLQQERLENAVRRFGEGDPRTLPYRYQLASYYDESRLRSSAREQYEKILLVQQQNAADPSALLRPLRELLRIDLLLNDRDDARTRIADLLASNPDLDPKEHALTLAALGDWAIAKEDPATARGYYAEAYRLLTQAGAEASSAFGVPEMIDFVTPLSAVDRGERRSRPYAWGSIELAFDVSAEGRASNVSVFKATPPGVMDEAYSRRVRETHFRPRIVDGEPVATAGVHSTHYFRYYVADKK